MTKLWFKAKSYGWGWTPITWQGWLTTLAYIGVILLSVQSITDYATPRELFIHFIAPVVVATLLMFWIASQKGERPHWSWGDRK